ncbi:hypothetical protein HELRODRAFT_188889 [Helobdella robusta]|uniref:Uncharacterized protein n=1 Tax=Helobdella robusta TaxID=6412 RepID=T1FQG0_HELRO|nr:hypothetical protein HELRODRAFT_188889 [Helobdella robusta]ESN98726.1 hypothetical protein HELRODRAFT_188889 [Helobdella robusta]
MSSDSKKQGFFSKLFSSSKDSSEKKKSRSSSSSSSHPSSPSTPATNECSSSSSRPQFQQAPQQQQPQRQHKKRNLSRKKTNRNQTSSMQHQPMSKVDVSKPLEFPATPETILAYHKKRPILSKNEEWLIVELNEFECLVESMDIVRTIAEHSKFFEVEPDDLWQEFFEFVEDLSSYDDIINFDVWQEFRDQKYPC